MSTYTVRELIEELKKQDPDDRTNVDGIIRRAKNFLQIEIKLVDQKGKLNRDDP